MATLHIRSGFLAQLGERKTEDLEVSSSILEKLILFFSLFTRNVVVCIVLRCFKLLATTRWVFSSVGRAQD